jgi:flap endonuclease-1
MGNSDIRDIAYIEDTSINDISGERVAVDASNWLYRYMTTTARFTRTDAYTNGDGAELSNLIGVPRGIRKFFQNNVQPVFVFDGKPNSMKGEEIERRKKKRSKAAEKASKADDSVKESIYESRSQQLSDSVIETTKKLLDLLDIPYVTAPQAAEAQAAYMVESDKIDAAVSDDYDSLIFGSKRTVRQFTTSSEEIELMHFGKTLDERNFNYDQLILSVILCGSDYNDGVSGVGPKTAMDLVQDYNSIDALRNELDSELERGEAIFELYKNPPTTDDWENPRASDPDIDEVRSYLNSQEVDVSEVDKALRDIKDSGPQTGLGSF